MKLTIIVTDKTVYKDREPCKVEVLSAPDGIHALQFDTETNTGHIEFTDSRNQEITELPNWAVVASNSYDTTVAAYESGQAAKAAAYQASRS
jgi:hypothetical protein